MHFLLPFQFFCALHRTVVTERSLGSSCCGCSDLSVIANARKQQENAQLLVLFIRCLALVQLTHRRKTQTYTLFLLFSLRPPRPPPPPPCSNTPKFFPSSFKNNGMYTQISTASSHTNTTQTQHPRTHFKILFLSPSSSLSLLLTHKHAFVVSPAVATTRHTTQITIKSQTHREKKTPPKKKKKCIPVRDLRDCMNHCAFLLSKHFSHFSIYFSPSLSFLKHQAP